MKRYLNSDSYVSIDIEIFVDHPILHLDTQDPHVVASADISKYGFPNRPVISKDKNRIEGWMIDDFDAFMDDIEILCEEDYNLIGTYKRVSKDNSHYYNYLATDSEGRIIVDLRLRLRISNHEPVRTKRQQHNKKEELNFEKLHHLLNDQDISRLKNYSISIVVNDERYDNYEEAFADVNAIVQDAVTKMKANEQYRPRRGINE